MILMKKEVLKMKVIKIISMLLILATIVAVFNGCVNPFEHKKVDTAQTALAIVIGPHANSKKVNLQNKQLYKNLFEICLNGGEVSIIIDDGEPYKFDAFTISPGASSNTKQQNEDYARENTNQLLALLGEAKAITSEVNSLAALELGARILNSSTCRVKKLIVLDSLLSTKGLVDFQEISLRCDSKAFLEEFTNTYSFIDLNLSEIDEVIISGLGDVASPQKTLSSTEKASLKDIWSGILYVAGAKTIDFDSDVATENYDSTQLPSVSTVDTFADELNTDNIINDIIIYDSNSTLGFVPDSTEFLDNNAASQELKRYAEYLKDNPTFQLLIAGSTATIVGSKESCKNFSLERALVCKNYLVQQGVCEEQIKCVGTGFENTPYRVDDINTDGTLNETKAQSNRIVVFMNADLPQAKELVSTFGN